MNPEVTILFPALGWEVAPWISWLFPVSAFDCDVLSSAFKNSVFEDNVPEDQWHEYAAQMIRDLTGIGTVDPELVEWIVRRSQNARLGAYSAHAAPHSPTGKR